MTLVDFKLLIFTILILFKSEHKWFDKIFQTTQIIFIN